jgi:hypothetical protein
VEDLSIFEGGSLSKSKIWRKLLMLSGSTLDTYQWQNLHSPAKNELFFFACHDLRFTMLKIFWLGMQHLGNL